MGTRSLERLLHECGRTQDEYTALKMEGMYQAIRTYDERAITDTLTALDTPPDRSRFMAQVRPIIDPEFDVFWSAYDLNIGKESAHKAWKRLHPSDREKARQVAGEYARANPDKRFRKSAAAWLTGRCWNDEIIDRSGRQAEQQETEIEEHEMASGKSPSFQFYANDFVTGCSMMTPSEVGCYILLLCEQWDKGSIPDDPIALQMLCRSAKPVSAKVLSKFRKGEDGMLKNARLEKTRKDLESYRDRISAARTAAARKRWPDASGYANGMQLHSNSISKSTPFMKSEDNNTQDKERALKGFDEFWTAYSFSKAKDAARRAWVKLKAEDREACMKALPAFVKGTHTDGTYPSRPHASTFLNGRRWEDDTTFPVVSGNGIAKVLTKSEALARLDEIRKANNLGPDDVVEMHLIPKEIRDILFK